MEIRDLLSKPVWQMTGEEFIFLNRHALQAVSYTHLDVYKRQLLYSSRNRHKTAEILGTMTELDNRTIRIATHVLYSVFSVLVLVFVRRYAKTVFQVFKGYIQRVHLPTH